jgi:hypothetical protein
MIAEADSILLGVATVAPDETVSMQVSKVLKGDPTLTGKTLPLISPYPEWVFPFLPMIRDLKDNPFVIIARKAEDGNGALLSYGTASIWPNGAPSDVPGKTLRDCLAFIEKHLGSAKSATSPSLTAKLSADTPQGESVPPFPVMTARLRLKWNLTGASVQPVEIRWIAADTGGVAPKDHVISSSKSEPGKTEGAFTLSKPTSGFPPGKYRVELRQADKIVHQEDFSIQ